MPPEFLRIVSGVLLGGLLGCGWHQRIGCPPGACPLWATSRYPWGEVAGRAARLLMRGASRRSILVGSLFGPLIAPS